MKLTEQRIKELEALKMELFSTIHPNAREDLPLYFDNLYLYHGIRLGTYQEQLEVVKKILKQGLLPRNQLRGYFSYSDNCNGGKRISLLEKEGFGDLEFETFVKPNLSLIISPMVEAYKTIYVSFDEWLELNEQQNLHNFYSYARNEYQVQESIPVSMIKAIGIPGFQMLLQGEDDDFYAKELSTFCNSLGLDIPIVDHSKGNQYIYKK